MTDDTSTDETDRRTLDPAEQRTAVRTRYARIATGSGSCCDGTESSDCCSTDRATKLGYTDDDLEAVGPGANLGLGCGNPTAIAGLEPGDTVLDLGSGGGFDCFLAARAVGPTGRVIGVDMTPAMIEKARGNIGSNDVDNVEFRLGEIEHLPVANDTVDVIISNCVINLSPDKPQVFREAYRVLRPGGRLAISDVVLTADPPDDLTVDPSSVAACVGGASTIPQLETMLDDAGFIEVSIDPDDDSEEFIDEWDPDRDLGEYIVAATIDGVKPRT